MLVYIAIHVTLVALAMFGAIALLVALGAATGWSIGACAIAIAVGFFIYELVSAPELGPPHSDDR